MRKFYTTPPLRAVPLKRARELRRDSTDAENKLWYQLQNRQLCGLKFRRQVPIGNFIVDFVCNEQKLVIEIDGGQHDENRKYDNWRSEMLAERGYRVIRFWNNDVLLGMDGVIEEIRKVAGVEEA